MFATRKLQAKLVLAFTFIIHLFKRLVFFWRRTENSAVFFSHFRSDGIYPIESVEREMMPSLQRCQACSLCTFTCEPVLKGDAPPGFEPKYVLLGLGRSPHESEVYLEEWLPCVNCSSCTVNCPNQVPLHQMAEQIIRRRQNFAMRNY